MIKCAPHTLRGRDESRMVLHRGARRGVNDKLIRKPYFKASCTVALRRFRRGGNDKGVRMLPVGGVCCLPAAGVAGVVNDKCETMVLASP